MSEEQNIEQTDSILSETSADWRSGLPQDIADHSAIKDIKSVEDLAKSTINAQQMLGGRVAIPSSDATKEEWDTFYGKIGRPEEIGGYETPQENMPQELTPEFDQALKVEAHRLGLTKGQYAGLARYMSQTAHATAEGQNTMASERKSESEKILRERFGAAYDQNIGLARSALQRFGGEELVKALTQSGYDNDPAMVEAFARIGRAVSEDEVIGGGGRQSFVMSPDEAKREIENLMTDPDFRSAYTQGHAPGHKAAVEKMQKLYQLAHG